ncbi:MAG TPA: lipoprotein insertase outer membrane protein LolB [Burkholderiales bacterium]|nr:lipoprotein insertase outer membrane protein LolB [Burkholderiales bacterium]
MISQFVSRFFLVVLLGACAAHQIKAPAPQATGAFELLGRVAVNSSEQKFSGNLRWMHDAEQDELWFLTPLGQGVAHLVKDAAGVTLKTQEQTYRAEDVESLTREVLGWGLPLIGLESWVRGVSVPGVPAAIERDDSGRLARVRQDGWEISYLRYSKSDGLPEKLKVSGRGLEITLVIDDWVLRS